MNWLHAFRMGGGSLGEEEVNAVRAVMAINGYRTVTEMWFINEVHRISDGERVWVRQLFGGDATMEDIHNDILCRLPGDLISALDSRFGTAQAHTWDDAENFQIVVDEWQDDRCTPNVGAATVLPLPK